MKLPLRPLAVAVLAVTSATHAQQAADRSEKIEVTGTRLPSSDADSASPIAVIRAEDIRLEGHQHLELLLANYPQITGAQGGLRRLIGVALGAL